MKLDLSALTRAHSPRWDNGSLGSGAPALLIFPFIKLNKLLSSSRQRISSFLSLNGSSGAWLWYSKHWPYVGLT